MHWADWASEVPESIVMQSYLWAGVQGNVAVEEVCHESHVHCHLS